MNFSGSFRVLFRMKKKKTTKIYLVRHGEVHNPEKILYGRIPGYKLSERGRNQAAKLGKFLSNRPVRAIYVSPLERTKETAAIVASFLPPAPISYDDRLLEVKTPLEGKLLSEFNNIFDFYSEPLQSMGGESMTDIWQRMESIIEEVKEKHSGSEVILVSHGDPIMITRAKHKGLPLVLDSIRGGFYVETAKGIQLVHEEEQITVEDLVF